MNARISVLPKTSLGRWSVGLAAACIMLLVLAVVLQGRPRVEGGSLLYAWLLLIALVISDIAALVTGLVSIIKTNERSILAFSAVVVTGLFTLFAFYMFIAESTYKP